MRKRLLVVVLVAIAMAFVLAGTALAAPAITTYGKTNGIDINYKSKQSARIYVVTDTGGTWVAIDVLNSKGVVRHLYSGAGASASAYLWTKPWNGTDAQGKYLPTGNYKYRITVTKGSYSATARGVIRVCTGIALVTVPNWGDVSDAWWATQPADADFFTDPYPELWEAYMKDYATERGLTLTITLVNYYSGGRDSQSPVAGSRVRRGTAATAVFAIAD
jgi:hypothetical protein